MTTLVRLLPLILALVLLSGVPGSAMAGRPPVGSRSAVGPSTSAAGVWPLRPVPRVVAGFDPPLSEYGAGHRGVDLAGRRGQVVRSTAAGRVTYAGLLAGRGVVVVSHGATRTTYEPVRAAVTVGSAVAAGDPLGILQTAASHCWPATCLHWGLIEGEVYLDPLTLVDAGPVRLLPLAGGPGGSTVTGSPAGSGSLSGSVPWRPELLRPQAPGPPTRPPASTTVPGGPRRM